MEKYFQVFINGMASIFSDDKRKKLVQKTIVQMQDHLFNWCHNEKFDKLGNLYDPIEKLLGRSRRQIDTWAKNVN